MSDVVHLPGAERQLDLSVVEDAAVALTLARHWYEEVRSVQGAARHTLREEADRRGQRTFEVGGHKIVVENPSYERTYDVAVLHDGLEEAGLDAARLSLLITWMPVIDGKIIRELERHPQFKQAIDAAIQSVTEKTRTVKVD